MPAAWKKVIVSGSSAELANVNIDSALRVSGSVAVSTAAGAIVNQIGNTQATTFLSGSFTGSFTGVHTGSLFGTASNAISSSYALTASFLAGGVAAQVFPYTGSAQITGSLGITGSLNVSGGIVALLPNATQTNIVAYNSTTGVLSYTSAGALSIVSASYAATASYAVQTIAALSQTANGGITAFSYIGSSSVQISVSGAAALTANSLPKWTGAGFSNSNISDTGTAISFASTIPVTVNSNLTVTGDLTVAGTASFLNTQNVLIGDRFLVLASGSTSLTDGGFIVATSTGAGGISGSAFFVESTSAGLYGRFAVAPNVHASSSTVVADEYMNTTKISATNPSDATPPTWGSTTNGIGNMWVNTTTDDIYIWA
jgi:hypothetical protein